jgi:CheY-like chemotaxis protein
MTAPSVLIVEDERIVARDLQQTLRGMGYDAFAIARSADEALAHAAERRPGLALVDIRIEGELDGTATAALLRERYDVPIVFLTAHADDETIARAKQSDPYGYLVKPVKHTELKTAIEWAKTELGKLQNAYEMTMVGLNNYFGQAQKVNS